VELTELRRTRFPPNELSPDEGRALWLNFRKWVDVSFPSPATEWQWELYSSGAVGYLPLASGSVVTIKPRVPIESIFQMWERAEDVKLDRPPGEVELKTVEDLLDWIAAQLSNGVLRRLGHGLYRTYVDLAEELSLVRGRIDLRSALRRPWRVALPCEFQELTADIADNQILLAGLVASSYLAWKPATVSRVRQGRWMCLRSGITPVPVQSKECVGRTYNRLNSDYERLHWLCHFILSGTVPTHEAGQAKLQAFIIQMPKLFERFVAAWLSRNLPFPLRCEKQVRLPLDRSLEFIADLVIRSSNGKPAVVVDTKYKIGAQPDPSDIGQVVAYAQHLGCSDAVLIYPTREHHPMDIQVGDIRVRTLVYPLDGDLDANGNDLIRQLELV
jgi:5-methylcytosine-specific restriction enzyme subunit McrC